MDDFGLLVPRYRDVDEEEEGAFKSIQKLIGEESSPYGTFVKKAVKKAALVTMNTLFDEKSAASGLPGAIQKCQFLTFVSIKLLQLTVGTFFIYIDKTLFPLENTNHIVLLLVFFQIYNTQGVLKFVRWNEFE